MSWDLIRMDQINNRVVSVVFASDVLIDLNYSLYIWVGFLSPISNIALTMIAFQFWYILHHDVIIEM